MDIKRACEILQIAYPPQANDIKSAYRKRAKETHPDSNPTIDVSEYIKVQTAFETLKEFILRTNGAFVESDENLSEPVKAINERIDLINDAINHFIDKLVNEFIPREAQRTIDSLAFHIDNYKDRNQLKKKIQNDAVDVWEFHVSLVSKYLQSSLSGIADEHLKWLEGYFAKTSDAIKNEMTEPKEKSKSPGIMKSILFGLIGIDCVVLILSVINDNLPLLMLTIVIMGVLLIFVGIFGSTAESEGSDKKNSGTKSTVEPVFIDDLTKEHFMRGFSYKDEGLSEEAAGGIGAAIGLLLFGPWGLLVGLFTMLFGKSFDEVKRDAFEKIIEVYEKEEEKLMGGVEQAVVGFRQSFIDRVKKNFYENLHKQVKLLKAS